MDQADTPEELAALAAASQPQETPNVPTAPADPASPVAAPEGTAAPTEAAPEAPVANSGEPAPAEQPAEAPAVVDAVPTSDPAPVVTASDPVQPAAQTTDAAVEIQEPIYPGPAPAGPYWLMDTEHGKINEIASHLSRPWLDAIAAIEAVVTEFSDPLVGKYKDELLTWLKKR